MEVAEINIMKEKLRDCVFYAGVNQYEDCGYLAEELWSMIMDYDRKVPATATYKQPYKRLEPKPKNDQ